ncbi:MAG: type II secretion system protein GspN [bacterium]
MLKKLFVYLIAAFLFCLILFMSFWLSISETKLESWLQYRLNRSLPRQTQVTVQNVRTRFWGLEIQQVELRDTVSLQEWVKIDTLKIRFDLLALFLRQELPFNFHLYGGQCNGALGFFPSLRVKLKIVNLEPNWIPIVRRTGLVLSKPLLQADGLFIIDTLTAKIQLNLKDIRVTGNKAITTLPLDLPDTTLIAADINVTLKRDQLSLTLATEGDISAQLEGIVTPNWQQVQKSMLDLRLTANIAPPYQSKLGAINNIISSYSGTAGRISIRLTGNLTAPQIQKI